MERQRESERKREERGETDRQIEKKEGDRGWREREERERERERERRREAEKRLRGIMHNSSSNEAHVLLDLMISIYL